MAHPHALPWQKLIITAACLTAVVWVISRFWMRNTVVFVFLLCAVVAVFLRKDARGRDAIPIIVGAVTGPTMEAIIIHFGGWTYSNPSFFGIPVWLPLLWGLSIFFLMRISIWVSGDMKK